MTIVTSVFCKCCVEGQIIFFGHLNLPLMSFIRWHSVFRHGSDATIVANQRCLQMGAHCPSSLCCQILECGCKCVAISRLPVHLYWQPRDDNDEAPNLNSNLGINLGFTFRFGSSSPSLEFWNGWNSNLEIARHSWTLAEQERVRGKNEEHEQGGGGGGRGGICIYFF